MIEERIKAIKDKVEQVVLMLSQRGEPPEEVKEALREFFKKAITEIQTLRQEQKQEKEQQELQEAEQEQSAVSEELAPQQQMPPQISGEAVPPLNEAPYPSSNISAFKYDDKKGKLYVRFQDKYPRTNGPVYAYEGVPKFLVDVFVRGAVAPKTSGKNKWHRWQKGVTPSLGASMNALIKSGAFPYTRLR